MGTTPRYERYPVWGVLLSVGQALAIYALGAFVLARLAWWLAVAYVLFCLWAEVSILRGSCVHCYYYGKLCGLGRGKLCGLLFRRGDPARFLQRTATWRDILPDMLVLALPVVGGIVALVLDFSWVLLGALLILVLLSLVGNALVRGSFACKHCKQRELGCPAEKLFAG
ncbi:MAG: hypothetical protein V1772_03240 [Chloroflexota bacterium]